jgi:hypothetical protein
VLPEIAVDVDDPTVEWGLLIALLAEAAIASPLPAGTERFRFERLNILRSEKNCNKFKFHSYIKLRDGLKRGSLKTRKPIMGT